MESVDLNNKNIKLIEVMNSWQGEGPNSGRQMLICRFKSCNMRCRYCDTQIKMSTSIEGSYSINDINIALTKTRGLMITGGEPTFSSPLNDNLNQTIDMLKYCEYDIANIETNGYHVKDLLSKMYDNDINLKKVNVIVSPKIFTQKQFDTSLELVADTYKTNNVYFKVVVDGSVLVNDFIKQISWYLGKGQLYLMPLGTTIDEINKSFPRVVDLADENNCNITSRLHITNAFT